MKDVTERFPDPLGDELPFDIGDTDDFEGGLIDWHDYEVDEVDEVSYTVYGTYKEYSIMGYALGVDVDEIEIMEITND